MTTGRINQVSVCSVLRPQLFRSTEGAWSERYIVRILELVPVELNSPVTTQILQTSAEKALFEDEFMSHLTAGQLALIGRSQFRGNKPKHG